jgi:predicted RNA methylase
MDVKNWKIPTKKCYDMVIMNPPFGTKDEGIDAIFLEKAACIFE